MCLQALVAPRLSFVVKWRRPAAPGFEAHSSLMAATHSRRNVAQGDLLMIPTLVA